MPSPRGKTKAESAINRRFTILKALPQHYQKMITTQELREKLASLYDIEADDRTIQRDLIILSRTYSIFCHTSKPNGWRWMKGAHGIDQPAMDPQTALTFQMVEKYLAPLVPAATLAALAPYLNHARRLLNRSPEGNSATWPDKIEAVHRSELLIPPALDETLVATIYQALFEGIRFRAQYRPKSESTFEERIVSPLGLVLVDRVPCLVATLWEYEDVRQLPLTRFSKVELLYEPVTPPPGFFLKKYIAEGAFSYPVAEEPIRLKFRIDQERSRHLEETKLSGNQILTDLENGIVEVTATVHDTLQLRFWLNGFGADLEVLEPEYLRKEYEDQAKELARKYRRKKQNLRTKKAIIHEGHEETRRKTEHLHG